MKEFYIFDKSSSTELPEASLSELIAIKIENVNNISLDKLERFIMKL